MKLQREWVCRNVIVDVGGPYVCDSNDKNYSFGEVQSHILSHFRFRTCTRDIFIVILETENKRGLSVQLKAPL